MGLGMATVQDGILEVGDRPKTIAEWQAVVETVRANSAEIKRVVNKWNKQLRDDQPAEWQDNVLIYYVSLMDELIQKENSKVPEERRLAGEARKLLCH